MRISDWSSDVCSSDLLGLGGFRPVSTAYYYLVIGLFGGVGFLAFPGRKGETGVRWYDWLLVLTTVSVSVWFASRAQYIIDRGWNLEAPVEGVVTAGIYVLPAREGLRRTGRTLLCCFLIVRAMCGAGWGLF